MSEQTAFFTIASRNYLPQVRCLMESLKQHHPDARHLLCLVEEEADPELFGDEGYEVILAKDVIGQGFLDLAYKYSITELNTAVKPFVMERLLDDGAQHAFYIDPDCYLFAPLEEVDARLAEGANIVVTPHVTHPIDDDKKPNEKDFLRTGTFNLGFLAVRSSPETRRFLTWWQRRLTNLCVFDPLSGLFVDQKWVDLAPSFFEGVEVLRHPGYNVAYWNAFQRSMERRPGGWHVDEEPLRFVHFSGLPIDDVAAISRHQDRMSGEDLGAFVAEFHTYLGRLASHALKPDQERPYSYSLYWRGQPIESQALRTALRRLSPTRVESLETFRDEAPVGRMLEPHPELPRHEMFPISRLMYDALLDRPVIARHYPLFTAEGRARFLYWVLVEGFVALEIDRRLLPWTELSTPVEGAIGGHFAVPPMMWLLWQCDAGLRRHGSFDSEKGYAHLLIDLRKEIVAGSRPEWQLPREYTDRVVLGKGRDAITVAQYAVWLIRKDLQDAFDLEAAEGRTAFRGWCEGPSPTSELPEMAELVGSRAGRPGMAA